MTCNVDAISKACAHTCARAYVVSACVEQLIKMCNRFTDPDMPLEQKVIIHTV